MATVKVIEKSVKDPSLAAAFEGLLGVNGANLEVVLPKITKIKNNLLKIKECLMRLSTKSICDENSRRDIESWYEQNTIVFGPTLDKIYRKFSEECKAKNISDGNQDILSKPICDALVKSYTETDFQEFNDEYAEFKRSPQISTIIVMCRDLEVFFKSDIEKNRSFSAALIEDIAGHEFKPLILTRFNFKPFFVNLDTPQIVKDYLLNVLAMLHKTSREVVNLITSPDIDVEAFSQVIVENISKLKKHIPRCDDAFDKIEQSVNLLCNNFSSYYKGFVITKNASSIMENFVMDVATNTVDGENNKMKKARLLRQFKVIVMHYKKLSKTHADKSAIPGVDTLFKKLDENFKTMDDLIGKNKGDSDDEPEQDAEDDSKAN